MRKESKLPRLLSASLVLALVVGPITISSAAPPTCFGKRATIVGPRGSSTSFEEIVGTPGDDVIVTRGTSDRIEARGGDDLICSGDGDDYIVAGRGNDKVRSQGAIDTVIGGPGRDRLWGGRAVADSLLGGPGDDRLFGGPGGFDSLIGGPGDDHLDGGPGYDRAEFFDSPAPIEADLGDGSAIGQGDDRLVSIEGLVGSHHDDVLIGDELSNDLMGGGGDDLIRALGSVDGGMDILRSSEGDAVLDGGDGQDIVSYNVTPWPVVVDLPAGRATKDVYGSDELIGIEHITGSKESDTLLGDAGDNVIIGNFGDDVIDGGAGIDEAPFLESRVPMTVDLSAGTADSPGWGTDTLANIENLAGSLWRDHLTGDDGPNFIWGGDRGDLLFGLGGDDVLEGAKGPDEADGGPGTDTCDAETEVACELEPTARAASSAFFRSLDLRWPQGRGLAPRD